ncbi:sensor domain-containing diguanylate cyclase [Ancylobacter lacus]|uniref:sensor domain-containing diguanylate cyclase n=1 Tax=Ancylobacter lacus TaxID=2579970 RepID=UPI001BCB58EB|nr:diguanylate cyclase [Ancylobacter lacus]MBS7537622.1 diguanylate cyclase [Ancylobacter lacus]
MSVSDEMTGFSGRRAGEARQSRLFPARGRRTSLRSRLIGLVAIGLAFLLAERVASINAQRHELLAAASKNVLDLTNRGLAQYREVLATVHGTLQAVSLGAVESIQGGPGCASLQNIVELVPEIGSIALATPQGQVVCASAPTAMYLDLSQRDYMRIALRGHFALSSVSSNYVSGLPSIFAAQPVVDDEGNVIAVVVARIQLDLIFPLSIISDLDLSAAVLMIDPEGAVINASPNGDTLAGKDLRRTPLVSYMLSRSSGTFTTAGPDGVERIYGFERLPESNMRLAVGISASTLKAEIETATLRAVAIFLAACAVIFIGLWIAGERLMVRPVQELAMRLAAFGRGQEPAQAEASSLRISELDPLVDAFTDMAARLTERETALQEANRQLNLLANRDPLTGVANRRAFDEAVESFRGPGGRVAMLMIDIDYFKEFNDRYGHAEGDSALRRVAAALAANVRREDLVARIGGEEFAVLLPRADSARAGETANRLRLAIEEIGIAHAGSTHGRVTVSIGFAASRPEEGVGPSTLLVMADRALYAAKAAGRNAVRGNDSGALPASRSL